MTARPYTHPLVRSIAAPGGRFLPSRSHGVETLTEGVTPAAPVLWSPFMTCRVDPLGPRLSSGPQAGQQTRHATGTAYITPPNLWNLSGVATGWSFRGATPSKQPTTKLAIGRGWRPFGAQGANSAPLPSLPDPARMVAPFLPR